MANRFQYPRDLIPAVREGWDVWLPRDGDIEPLPPDEILAEMFEVAYHASFTADEQRATAFRLLCSEHSESSDSIIFQSPRGFNGHELMRLAPAVAPSELALGTTIADGRILIWGLCSYAHGKLSLSVPRPGALLVGRNGRVIASLRDGVLKQTGIEAVPFDLLIEMFSAVSEEMWRGVDWAGGSWDPTRTLYPGCFLDLLHYVSAHGHGGTLFVIPEGDAVRFAAKELLRVKYACNDTSTWELIQKYVHSFDSASTGSTSLGRDYYESAIKAQLQNTARLTRVDGALLLTDHFRLLGFGVEVIARPTSMKDVQIFGSETTSIDAYGTRHRSAFRLCEQYPEAIAFVCSQDGGVKCVRNMAGVVTLWR